MEIGLKTIVPFREIEFVFGCDGHEQTKPYAKQWIERFSANAAKTTWGRIASTPFCLLLTRQDDVHHP